jgi:hypothetical protein
VTERVQTRLDDDTLVVRIPMRFQCRGGRKRIVAPDGSEIAPSRKPQPDGALIKALARAWRWQRMLDEGLYGSVMEIAKAERISKSYVSWILRLGLLAPVIVEDIRRAGSKKRCCLKVFAMGGQRTGLRNDLICTHSTFATRSFKSSTLPSRSSTCRTSEALMFSTHFKMLSLLARMIPAQPAT